MAATAEQVQEQAQPAEKTIDEAISQLRLIGIAGLAGTGKTTIAEYLYSKGAKVIACADPIKEALSALFGFPRKSWQDREWKERPLAMIGQSPRQLAQTFGTEWGRRMVNEDIWISEVISRWRKGGYELAVVPDVRFDNEALTILRSGGVMIRVTRDDAPPVAPHLSETPIPDNLIHLTIENNGTIDDLFEKVDRAIVNHVKEAEAVMMKQQQDANGQ